MSVPGCNTATGDGRARIGTAGLPVVSVVIANFNGARFIEQAIGSALGQTLRDIEIIVADDRSTDDSIARITALAADDTRLTLLRSGTNLGPAAARNLCLQAARGRFVAVLDSDDLMHPERLERLVSAAERDAVDIAADDLLIFDADPLVRPKTCLRGRATAAARDIGLIEYVRANTMFRRRAALGYLKPLIRTALLAQSGVRYDPGLRIGEDYDFVARLLAHGARFRVYPELTYFYRKHAGSVSHRLSAPALSALLAANDRLRAMALAAAAPGNGIIGALAEREAMLQRALRFEALVTAIKQRRWQAAAAIGLHHPSVAARLREPVGALLRRALRRLRHNPAGPSSGPAAAVISRQRVVGETSGSARYLLDLLRSIAARGISLHLICPSPAVFGRQPILRLRPEMRAFRSIAVRGSIRCGRTIVAVTPQVWLRALIGIVGHALLRVGIPADRLTRAAPYAIAAPWSRRDLLFLARHARRHGDLIVADYAFLAGGIPYVLRPDAPSLVVMHDLFCSRTEQFDRLGAADSVAEIGPDAEMRLLGMAEAVVAIQPEEAGAVRARLPGHTVLVAPPSVRAVASAQPGTALELLFVGTKTAPNVLGLRWFIGAVWPAIRSAVPAVRLTICGTVGSASGPLPDGVEAIGPVADLAPFYRRAAVVIAPLNAGSGLKIKLVEALGQGKAMVVTTPTLQGVGEEVRAAVAVADAPDDFAAAVIRLLGDETLRRTMGRAALAAAGRHYAADVCHSELLAFLKQRGIGRDPPAAASAGAPTGALCRAPVGGFGFS